VSVSLNLNRWLAGLIRLRFTRVGFAAFFAAAISADHPNTSTVAAQLPAVKINCTIIFTFNRSIRQLSIRLIGNPTQFLTTPAAVLAVFG